MYPCAAVEHSYNCMVLLCSLFLWPSGDYTNKYDKGNLSRLISDLDFLTDITNTITFGTWGTSTAHSPYVQGITGYGNGLAIGLTIGTDYGVQLALAVGESKVFIRAYVSINGGWTQWSVK